MPWSAGPRREQRYIVQIEYAPHHIIPCGDNGLHIEITREKCHNSVWNDLAVLNENAPKVAHDGGVVSNFELRANGYLIASTSYHLHRWLARGQPAVSRYQILLTNGKKQLRVNVIGYVSWSTGVNWSIFGYISRGEMVPEVMTTLLNRSKTGFIASDGSRHLEREDHE